MKVVLIILEEARNRNICNSWGKLKLIGLDVILGQGPRRGILIFNILLFLSEFRNLNNWSKFNSIWGGLLLACIESANVSRLCLILIFIMSIVIIKIGLQLCQSELFLGARFIIALEYYLLGLFFLFLLSLNQYFFLFKGVFNRLFGIRVILDYFLLRLKHFLARSVRF